MSAESTQSAMPAKRSVQEHQRYQDEIDAQIDEQREQLLQMAQSDAPIEEVRELFTVVVRAYIEKYRSLKEMLTDQKGSITSDIYEGRMTDLSDELERVVTTLAVSVDMILEKR